MLYPEGASEAGGDVYAAWQPDLSGHVSGRGKPDRGFPSGGDGKLSVRGLPAGSKIRAK